MESYSNLVPQRYPASVAHKTRTRGVSVYGFSLAVARKPRKLRDKIGDPQRDVLSVNINELSGGGASHVRTRLWCRVPANREKNREKHNKQVFSSLDLGKLAPIHEHIHFSAPIPNRERSGRLAGSEKENSGNPAQNEHAGCGRLKMTGIAR